MKRDHYIVIFAAAAYSLICSCYCSAAPGQNQWPIHARENIYLPQSARDVRTSSSKGLFVVSYRVNSCYPAQKLIKATSSTMRARCWDRMVYDPTTPGHKLPPDYPSNNWSWLGHYPWDAYWTDKGGDVVWYEFGYDVPGSPNPAEFYRALETSCSALVRVTYFSRDAFKLMLEEHRQMLEKARGTQGKTTGITH